MGYCKYFEAAEGVDIDAGVDDNGDVIDVDLLQYFFVDYDDVV